VIELLLLAVLVFVTVAALVDFVILWWDRPGVVKDSSGRWVAARSHWHRTRR